MTHFCYIIHSSKLDKFYIGETNDFSKRLQMHNIGFSPFTSRANDWRLHLIITCDDKAMALKIEAHIKSMKSRKYIENLTRYPEMVSKLLDKFRP
jgi:putative endonuclease